VKIIIETVPYKSQRYSTLGDWQWEDPDTLHIKVSKTLYWKHDVLIGLHEAVESLLCKQDGVTEQQVDEYDLSHPDAGDAEVDMADAPYLDQHSKATTIERMMAHFLSVDWAKYSKELDEIE
jgi:hypothetical protein